MRRCREDVERDHLNHERLENGWKKNFVVLVFSWLNVICDSEFKDWLLANGYFPAYGLNSRIQNLAAGQKPDARCQIQAVRCRCQMLDACRSFKPRKARKARKRLEEEFRVFSVFRG